MAVRQRREVQTTAKTEAGRLNHRGGLERHGRGRFSEADVEEGPRAAEEHTGFRRGRRECGRPRCYLVLLLLHFQRREVEVAARWESERWRSGLNLLCLHLRQEVDDESGLGRVQRDCNRRQGELRQWVVARRLEVLRVLVRWRRGREARSVPVAWARVHQRRRRRCEFLVREVAIWVIDEPSGAWSGKHPLHGRVHRWRRRQFRGIRCDVGGRGLILVLDSDPCSNLFIDSIWCGSSLLGHDQDVFPGRIRPGTRSWRSKGVAAVHPAVTTVKALAMGVAAKEGTTRTIATKRSTVWCIAAAEAAIPVQATLTAVAEVPMASSSRTKSPVRKMEAPAFPCHKSSESENKVLMCPEPSCLHAGYEVRGVSERYDAGLKRHDDGSLSTASGQRQDSNHRLEYSKESDNRLISQILILLDS
ncbi:uncharacterized protein [Triticum aestivum]|uniref:uncharacterized protein n=1 Tax=Triticum aestivum TaxID=4565 RepID=UPI001D030DBC|nr:uncharacterized protein LOC123159251 [Triticum aestivum]